MIDTLLGKEKSITGQVIYTTTYPEDLKSEIEYLVYAAATRLGDN